MKYNLGWKRKLDFEEKTTTLGENSVRHRVAQPLVMQSIAVSCITARQQIQQRASSGFNVLTWFHARISYWTLLFRSEAPHKRVCPSLTHSCSLTQILTTFFSLTYFIQNNYSLWNKNVPIHNLSMFDLFSVSPLVSHRCNLYYI